MLPYRDVILVGRTCRRFLLDLSKDELLLKNIARREMRADRCKFVNDDEANFVYPTREKINVASSLGSVIEIYFTSLLRYFRKSFNKHRL